MLSLVAASDPAQLDLSLAAPSRRLWVSQAHSVRVEVDRDLVSVQARAAAAAAAAQAAAEQAAATVRAIAVTLPVSAALWHGEPAEPVRLAIDACLKSAARATLAAEQALAAAGLLETALLPLEQDPCSRATQHHSY